MCVYVCVCVCVCVCACMIGCKFGWGIEYGWETWGKSDCVNEKRVPIKYTCQQFKYQNLFEFCLMIFNTVAYCLQWMTHLRGGTTTKEGAA